MKKTGCRKSRWTVPLTCSLKFDPSWDELFWLVDPDILKLVWHHWMRSFPAPYWPKSRMSFFDWLSRFFKMVWHHCIVSFPTPYWPKSGMSHFGWLILFLKPVWHRRMGSFPAPYWPKIGMNYFDWLILCLKLVWALRMGSFPAPYWPKVGMNYFDRLILFLKLVWHHRMESFPAPTSSPPRYISDHWRPGGWKKSEFLCAIFSTFSFISKTSWHGKC